MLVPLNDHLFCYEGQSCYCNEQALILTDDKDQSKIYYTCNNYDHPCGYFILAQNLRKCDSCDVYYFKYCSSPFCSNSHVWKPNHTDVFLSC